MSKVLTEKKIIKEYNEIAFDNEEQKGFLEQVFTFDPIYRNLVYKIMFEFKKPQQLVSLVLKYLLKVKKVNPLKAEKIIRKWCVTICYYYITTKYNYPEKTMELDKLLEKDVTVEELEKCFITSNKIIGDIFNNIEELNKNYTKSVEVFSKSLKGVIQEDDRSNISRIKISNLLLLDNYFFTNHNGKTYDFTNEFKSFVNKKSFDRLIPEVLNGAEPVRFTIEFTEEEFNKCLENYQTAYKNGKEFSRSLLEKAIPLMFGYMVSQMVVEENLDFHGNLKFLTLELLLLNLKQGTCDIIIDGFKPYTKNKLNKEEIVSCKFLLNEEEYLFSAEGLQKI